MNTKPSSKHLARIRSPSDLMKVFRKVCIDTPVCLNVAVGPIMMERQVKGKPGRRPDERGEHFLKLMTR